MTSRYCSVLLHVKDEEHVLEIIDDSNKLGLEIGFREVFGVNGDAWIFEFLKSEDYLIFCLKWGNLIQRTIYQ